MSDSFKERKTRAALMAKCSQLAYLEPEDAENHWSSLGYPQSKFISHEGAQCYIVWNSDETIIVFRGTEPTQWSDVKADLNAIQKKSNTKGDVHGGFKGELDKIWQNILMSFMNRGENTEGGLSQNHKFFITGHSLGAAMATIAASRLYETFNVQSLYTFGSPRVGDRSWVKNLGVTHYRFQNNNDIVCTVPFWFMGYRHHGKNIYIGYDGKINLLSLWARFLDGLKGRWRALKKKEAFDGIYDHDIGRYHKRIEKCTSGL
tara:strand:- start:4503 stop:5285 length:783 start_codon:yes stop_codon:yes gene_type:complete